MKALNFKMNFGRVEKAILKFLSTQEGPITFTTIQRRVEKVSKAKPCYKAICTWIALDRLSKRGFVVKHPLPSCPRKHSYSISDSGLRVLAMKKLREMVEARIH